MATPTAMPQPMMAASAPTPQPLMPQPMMAQGPTMMCSKCHQTFAAPAQVAQGNSNQRLCVSAVLCLVGCFPCALCAFFCMEDERTLASACCPSCGTANRIA
eukprot:GEMP01039663.1.p2 GENE.GEMP01039663.1~~GEMP01039663.1.p2  ORF type:complete len:102 (+),score=28.55 GEMP01039663.1:60-365(+)